MNEMIALTNNETRLSGQWVYERSKVVEDDVAKRIRSLIANELQKIATADGGWFTLYIDPHDNRFWELHYPHSEMHGGGPPELICIERSVAVSRYEIDSD